MRLALLAALALAGCATSGHPGPTDPARTRISAGPARGAQAPPSAAQLVQMLRAAFPGQTTPPELLAQLDAALRSQGSAYADVVHDDHEHHYVLVWVEPLRTLVFFERTGDGVEGLRAWPVD